jgi:hypothetical protein
LPHFFTRAERDQLAKSGEARADGSYPIRNAQDLENAAKDYARTGSDPSVAAWIGKRAKALGLPNPLAGDGEKRPASERHAATNFLARRSTPKPS